MKPSLFRLITCGSYLSVLFLGLVMGYADLIASPATKAEVAVEDSTYVEQPWPEYVTITTFADKKEWCGMAFTKFSSEENGSYVEDYRIISNLTGWENLPAVGYVRDPKTGWGFWYSVEKSTYEVYASEFAIGVDQIQKLEQELGGPKAAAHRYSDTPFTRFYTKAVKDQPKLQDFLVQLPELVSSEKYEVTEIKYVPPVWRKTPLSSGIRVLSVEQWNRENAHEKK
jgi:hypothetical protein